MSVNVWSFYQADKIQDILTFVSYTVVERVREADIQEYNSKSASVSLPKLLLKQ